MHKKSATFLSNGRSLILQSMIPTNEIIIAISDKIHPNLDGFFSINFYLLSYTKPEHLLLAFRILFMNNTCKCFNIIQ